MSESTFAYGIAAGQNIGGRYDVVKPNRQGGLSVAFEVRDTKGGVFEMQHFPAGLFESDEQAREFAASWEPWKTIKSPAVLAVRDVIVQDGAGVMLITDLPPGQPLRARLAESPVMMPVDAVALGRQLLEGLVEVHERNLVHGDIKPNTIFVKGTGAKRTAVLVDGGVTAGLWIAKDLGDKTALIGTPYYAPAEQFGGESPDVQSDLYNVATVMFELIAGRLPWEGANFLQVFQAKIAKEVPSLRAAADVDAEISIELENAITGGLHADPDERYTSASEFLEALDGVV
jgi:serine/threonine-protein kinase